MVHGRPREICDAARRQEERTAIREEVAGDLAIVTSQRLLRGPPDRFVVGIDAEVVDFEFEAEIEGRELRESRDLVGRIEVPDPVVETYKSHVDMTLIREQLRRTIDERVARMISALQLAEELRAAGRR